MADDGSFETSLDDARPPLVLGVDVGSTASRAGLYDARGLPVRKYKHKVSHAFTTAADGTAVIDPGQVADEVATCLTEITGRLPSGSVAAVAMDTFASSLVGVDATGAARTPCYTYADSRCTTQLASLLAEFDLEDVHDRTGTRLHTSYLAPRLRWLAETQPQLSRSVRRWLSLGEFVQLHLAGATAVATSTASWTGLLDRRTGDWVPELLEASRIDPRQLSPIVDPDTPVADADSGDRWPALAGAHWFAAVPDGVASNLGSGAADSHTVAIAMATSGAMRVILDGTPARVPDGLWCYRISAGQSILGGAVNDVGRAVTWLNGLLRLPDDTDLDQIASRSPSRGTPVVLPFLTGERSTGWRGDAKALLGDVAISTDGPALARGVLEGVALTYARVHDRLRSVTEPNRLVASGRVSGDLPGLRGIIADALGVPVDHAVISRATLHGTVLLALDAIAPDESRSPTPLADRKEPVTSRTAYYTGQRSRFDRLYDALPD